MNLCNPKLVSLVRGIAAAAALASGSTAFSQAVDAKLKAAVKVAATERVAIIALGDSNQRFGGHGYTAAMPPALAKVAPIYASELLPYRQWKEKDGPEPAAAPPELSALSSYWYIPEGAAEKVSWKGGQLVLPADHPIDVRGPLRFHLTYGTFKEGGTTFQPMVRRDQVPWTRLAEVSRPVKNGTGKFGLGRVTLDLPADSSRDYPLQFMPHDLREEIPGPFFAARAVAENTARKNGLAYHTLHGVGGHSLREMLTALRNGGEQRLVNYFADVRVLLNGKKTAIVTIHSGLNDRNRGTPSIGPVGGYATQTPEGYADNLRGMVELLTKAWVDAGGTPGTLHFAFMPSHVLGDPDDEKLVSYRQAARELAKKLPSASMIDLSELVPYSEMLEKRYYDKGRPSDSHLERAGYTAIAEALAAELRKP